MKYPVLYAFLGGCFSQLPGIFSSVVVIIGIFAKHATPDAFDFAAQVWQTPFAPMLPLLPRIQLGEVPCYYWATLLLSFLLPIFPAAGALVKYKLANQTARN